MSAAEKIDYLPTFADLARERRIKALAELLKATVRGGDIQEAYRIQAEFQAAIGSRRSEFVEAMERQQFDRITGGRHA